nr:hypothetical protein [Tanacetum cinerariifolium]
MAAEVDQNSFDKQCAKTERKNLLIENENLLLNCLSNQLFHVMEQLRCLDLKAEISKLQHESQKDVHNKMIKHVFKIEGEYLNLQLNEVDRDQDVKALESKNLELTEHVYAILEQNKRFRAENEKNLKAQLKGKTKCVTVDPVKPKVLAPGMYAIDVKPIPPRLKNNRDAHFDYLKHLKESIETAREIIEEARIEKPLDNVLASACSYTKRS